MRNSRTKRRDSSPPADWRRTSFTYHGFPTRASGMSAANNAGLETRDTHAVLTGLVASLVLMFAVGCADVATRDNLRAGYGALDAKQYDSAVQHADEQIAKSPQGPGSAEALYLKGRALEAKAAPGGNSTNPDADWQAARSAYVDALALNPGPKLEPHIRAGVANIAYFQNDYATALQQWTAAYDKIRDEETNAWILYRIGVCQQRLGDFDTADKTFATVQDSFKNTEAADRAR